MKTKKEKSQKQEQPMTGQVIKVTFFHDDDCPFLSGGPCTCEPEIRVTELEPKGGR